MAKSKKADMVLRDYQDECIEYTIRRINSGYKEHAIVIPTGGGKTLIIQVILTSLLSTGAFRKALVVTTQKQIEAGFHANLGATITGYYKGHTKIQESHWKMDREALIDVKTFLEAKDSEKGVRTTTHNNAVRWSKDLANSLPANLRGCVLVVDEAHRAGKYNKIGRQFIEAWKARNGSIIYLTATPFRTDGETMIPRDCLPYTRTIAQHAMPSTKDGECIFYAPNDLKVRAIPLKTSSAVSVKAHQGTDPIEGDRKKTAREIARLWDKDGRPKSVIILPPRSQALAEAVTVELKKLKAKAYDLYSDEVHKEEVRQKFYEQLESERKIEKYTDSVVDVFVTCKLFDEGTDWKLCSNVYMVGISSSFGQILQRWGRAMRLKSLDDYPEQFKNMARITFLVPNVTDDLWAKFSSHHKDYVHLLAAFLQDADTAQQYRACLRWRPEDIGRKRTGKKNITLKHLLQDVQMAVAQMLGEEISTKAILVTAKVEMALRELGNDAPTPEDIIEYAEKTLKLKGDVIQDMRDYWGVRMTFNDAADSDVASILTSLEDKLRKLQKRDGTATTLPVSIIRAELRAGFDRVIAKHSKGIIVNMIAPMRQYIGNLTGQTAEVIEKDLREELRIAAQNNASTMPLETGIAVLTDYYKEHGEVPEKPHHMPLDASPYLNMPLGTVTFGDVSKRLTVLEKEVGGFENLGLEQVEL